MTSPDNDLAKFSRLVEALRPWLGQIIFIGGRAHRLYRERPEAVSVAYEALQTDDADVALNPRTMSASKSIRARLKEFGFEEEFSGDDLAIVPKTRSTFTTRSNSCPAQCLRCARSGRNR